MARRFGHIPGVREGALFGSRREAHDAGVHRPLQGGISGAAAEGADSIVVSGGYEDDQDFGDIIVYTGHGGNDPNSGQQVADQVLERGNAALALNHARGLPVRVIRGANGDPTFSPPSGYRYDGLFLVDDFWEETGRSGYRIWRFRLVKKPTTTDARSTASRTARGTRRPRPRDKTPASSVGTAYVEAVATVGVEGEPFEVDPDRLDRATGAHAHLQNGLAQRLRELGLQPLSPALPGDPEFDIAWRHDNTLCVCEVKTISAANRDRQMRLGLGQVLHYAAALALRGDRVVPLLLTPAPDGEPDRAWKATLTSADVVWVWPEMLSEKSATNPLLPGAK